MAKVVVVGSTSTDMTVRVPRIPAPGETAGGRDCRVRAGGKGANRAVAVARASLTAEFVTAVGDDASGEQALASLGAEGIGLGLAHRVPCGIEYAFGILKADSAPQDRQTPVEVITASR